MTNQQPQLYTPPQLADYLGIELGALQMTFYRLKFTGWNKRQQFTTEQQQQLIEKYRGISDNNNNTPSVSKPTATTTTNKKTMTTTTTTNNIKKTDNIILEPTQATTTQDAKEQPPPPEPQQQQRTTYNRNPLKFFCASLVVINMLVDVPDNWGKDWNVFLLSVIICFIAPFVEYSYSDILIEIWNKATQHRRGLMNLFYKESFAIVLLTPAMLFQATNVQKAVNMTIKTATMWDSFLPFFIAFSYQLLGLMLTLHPKAQGDREQ